MVSSINTNMCCSSYDAVIPEGLILGDFDDLIQPAIASPSPSPSPPPPQLSPVPHASTTSPREMTLLDDPAIDDIFNSSTDNKKRVRFHEARVVSLLVPVSEMSQNERDELWYHTSELDAFKTQARNQCRDMRVRCALQLMSPVQQEQHYQESSRGLEHRICLERQKNKVLAIRCTLKAQIRFHNNPMHIAMVATKCTSWAKEVALVEASRDFCDVYHPHLSHLIQDVTSPTSSFPVPLRRGGASSSPSDSNSNKRRSPGCDVDVIDDTTTAKHSKRRRVCDQNQGLL